MELSRPLFLRILSRNRGCLIFPWTGCSFHHCSERSDANQHDSIPVQFHQPSAPSPPAHSPLPLAGDIRGPSEKRHEKRAFGLFNVRSITRFNQLPDDNVSQRPAKSVKSSSQSPSTRGNESWKNFLQGTHPARVLSIKVEELSEEDMIIA
jgi:hypothetical protein